MDKAAREFMDSKYSTERLVEKYDRYQDVISDRNNCIIIVFKDRIEYQYALATKTGVLDVNMADILYINAGGSIISLTRDNLTNIKGKRKEALLIGW